MKTIDGHPLQVHQASHSLVCPHEKGPTVLSLASMIEPRLLHPSMRCRSCCPYERALRLRKVFEIRPTAHLESAG